jgi:hypothetical protein
LHISETTYYTAFLLRHMTQVRTVVSVVAPRDFEKCASPKEHFFSETLAAAYVFRGMSPFPIHFANFRPIDFLSDALHIKRMRTDPYYQFSMVMDGYGSSPLHTGTGWLPEPVFDDMCFAALREFEKVVNAAGARLVLATVPLAPEWRLKYDPHDALVRWFEARVRAALVAPSTQLLPGKETGLGSLSHADAVHYMWESTVKYTDDLADQIAGEWRLAVPSE